MPHVRQVLLYLFTILLAAAAFGQGTTGSLVGAVTQNGSPLPGVTVTATSPALQGSRSTTSGDGGGYNFPSLPPGQYTVTFELEGMQKVTKKVAVTLAQTARGDADLKMSSVSEAITVTASAPAVLETTELSRNFTSEQVALLPVRRNITDTVVLAPGVNVNGARGNITISGSPSYDNLFLVNGVVVNENLRGQPHDLFIEDAIQETTVLTGSISAEYGRFSGGVVSTITKSGGNEFSGSLRDSISNADWIDLTPIEQAGHPDKLIHVYEGTLGGFIWKDRLWFFGSGRKTSGAPAVGINPTASTVKNTNALNVSPVVTSFQNTVDEKRYEGKLTAQILPQHSIIASYLDIKKTELNNFFAPIYDVDSIVDSRELPNKLLALSYNGVVTSNLMVEANYSEKDFAFINSGGRFTDQIRGTWLADSNARWNAPVFCGVCTPEERNNDSKLLKGTYFFNTKSLGTHSVVLGGEDFHETRLVNNFQSASQYTVTSTGTAILMGANIFPRLDRSSTITWNPIFSPSTGSDLSTRSYFLNDKWDFNKNFSFNLGVRYDKNNAVDASGNTVSDDSAFAPRLGMIFDPKGDGRYRFNASYSHYVTKIVDGNIGGRAAGAGNPATFNFRYETNAPFSAPIINAAGTPANQLVGTTAALTALFNWFNALTPAQKGQILTSSSIPGLTTQIDSPISSEYVREMTVGFGTQITQRAFARVDVISRDWHDFFAVRLDQGTGRFSTTNPVSGAPFTGDRGVLVNDDDNISRKYRGVQLTFNWNPSNFNLGGGYTWAKLTGNDVPEGDGTAAVPNQFGQFYPEYLNYDARQPSGYLTGDQRHRAKVWAGYDIHLPFNMRINTSVIESYDSGRAYSAVGNIDAYGATNAFANSPFSKENNGANSPYTRSQLGTSHTYYFGKRGEFRSEAATSTDIAVNLSIPISRFELFVQGQVLNFFDQEAVNNIFLGNVDMTVRTLRSNGAASGLLAFNPYTDTPKECPQGATPATCTALGANYQLGDKFGAAANQNAYQSPRTYRVAVGFRF
jgi:hypothetical protein